MTMASRNPKRGERRKQTCAEGSRKVRRVQEGAGRDAARGRGQGAGDDDGIPWAASSVLTDITMQDAHVREEVEGASGSPGGDGDVDMGNAPGREVAAFLLGHVQCIHSDARGHDGHDHPSYVPPEIFRGARCRTASDEAWTRRIETRTVMNAGACHLCQEVTRVVCRYCEKRLCVRCARSRIDCKQDDLD